MKRFPAIGKYDNQTFSEMISFIEDPLLRWLTSSYSMYTGSCTEEVNGLMMSAMVYRYVENGPHFVKHGTGKLITELENVITKNNGHVFKSKSVDSIKVEGGIVKGIRTADGKEYTTKCIISAINTHDTFF
jgi:phytoene dehydrogenase-like protein